MNDEELIMKYKENEMKYKELFKDEDNLFPTIWESIKNIELKIYALEGAISMKKNLMELDSTNQIVDLDNKMTIQKNVDKIRREMIENAINSLKDYGK